MQAVRQMRQLQDTSEHVMFSHYSSMHIHGVRIVIAGPGAAHNFHEKAAAEQAAAVRAVEEKAAAERGY
jgi:hypothetical protein